MDDATLIRFLAGESDANERRAVEAWAAASDENADALCAFASVWRLSSASETRTGEERQAAWRTLESRLTPIVPLPRSRPKRTRPMRALRWAAAVAAILGSSLVVRQLGHDHSAVTTFETRAGEQGRLNLSDGSTVLLGPGSTLVLRADFGEVDRRVALEGEALFDVREDASRRFLVDTGRGLVEVVGTEFVVRSFADEAEDRVAVRSGRVRFSGRVDDPSTAAVLQAGDVARLDSPIRTPSVTSDTLTAFAWASDSWAFDGATLAHVASELGRRWGRTVMADSSVAGRRVTGAYGRESPQELLAAITLATGTRATTSGDTVRFLPPDSISR